MNWADLVLVMENEYRSRIWDQYKHLQLPPVEILDIPDDYEYMDEELVDLLTERINDTLSTTYNM